ncbi:MAG TPA: tetratricopeptide repeat protein [Longimicrobiales bacterium]
MFRLRLFGGLALEDNGVVHGGKAAQRRRLALLALLEVAPRRTLTRDKLIALLWGDQDAEHARHRLSVVLHELRKVVGEDGIRSVGDDVSLNPAVVGSDVADFQLALENGDFERAVALHEGAFLDGVYLSDAPEFERWVDSERERLERSYRTALERLAERHEARGNWQAAAEAWRRLAAADSYNSRVAARCVRALANAGERPSALQFARAHESLIREDLQTEPNAEFRAALAEVNHIPESPPRGAAPAAVTAAPAGTVRPHSATPALKRRGWRLRRSQRRVVVSAFGVALATFLIAPLITKRLGPTSEATPEIDRGVVVGVLPFANVSDNRSNEHLSDGLTEEMISALGKLPRLNVPSRTTVFAYKARNVDAQTAARELRADYLMEGSVRRAGAQLRITVRVLDDGGKTVWTDTYDRSMDAIFEVQREIAAAAVAALQVRLNQQLPAPALQYTTRDPEAYDLYLRGRSAWYSRSPDRLQSALRFFRQAVERDSTYALAYAGIADVYNMMGAFDYGLMRPANAYPQARAAAVRALRLEPQLAEARAALGNYLYNYEWKWADAERELRLALTYNPGYTMARHWLELVLLISGQDAEALAVIRDAREQDPRSPLISSALARHYYYRREYDLALREFEHALALDPAFLVARLGLGMTYTAAGRYSEAIEQLNGAIKLTGADVPVTRAVLAHALASAGEQKQARVLLRALESAATEQYVAPHFLALVHAALGDEERALTALEAAFQERSGAMLFLPLEPALQPLHDQPRFQALVKRVHGAKRAP